MKGFGAFTGVTGRRTTKTSIFSSVYYYQGSRLSKPKKVVEY